jgi:DNA-binding NarL/FixJ family response regulator
VKVSGSAGEELGFERRNRSRPGGAPVLSPAITRRLMQATVAGAGGREKARAALGRLTARELEVALRIARGRSNAEIAAELTMSVATVKAHVSSILAKLDLANRTAVALLAHEADVVT